MAKPIANIPNARPRQPRWAVAWLSAAGSLGLAATVLSFAVAPALGQPAKTSAESPTVVTVTLGKPSEFRIKLSKGSVPLGKVTFKVSNKGKKSHSFKICTATTYSTAANTCLGAATKVLKPGGTATLNVTLTLGIHEYLSSVPGQAKAGMKGGLDVVEPVDEQPEATTGDTTCASPRTTNVTVDIFDYGFTLTPSSAPCGTVVFAMANNGTVEHDFNILRYGTLRAVGEFVQPGYTATLTTVLNPGSHPYICDVFGHVMLGMSGTFRVTG
jgi:uncharacterized cupredoxin-like copper-binding protein